jgi:hypothetical protein
MLLSIRHDIDLLVEPVGEVACRPRQPREQRFDRHHAELEPVLPDAPVGRPEPALERQQRLHVAVDRVDALVQIGVLFRRRGLDPAPQCRDRLDPLAIAQDL